MSPEVINNDKKCGTYSDLWAVGCILYSLIYKNPPFNAITEYLIFQNINHLNFYFPKSRLINIEAKNLINNFEDHIDPKDPTNNCLDVAIITAPEKRTQKTIDKLKTVAGRALNK